MLLQHRQGKDILQVGQELSNSNSQIAGHVLTILVLLQHGR